MNRTRKTKGRNDLVHLLRQVHITETRKVTGKAAMTEAPKANQHLLVKVRQGKQTGYLVQTPIKEDARSGSFHVVVVMFPNVQDSNQQVDADSETNVHTNTQLNF